MRDLSKDISIKKPSVALRGAEVAVRKKLGLHVPADPRRSFTDRMEALSPLLTVGYKTRPNTTNLALLVEGANLAARIMRKANDAFAAITFLRKDESDLMQDVLATHFHLIPGDDGGGLLKDNKVNKSLSLRSMFMHDRRWVIEKIRRNMLSVSAHLNTGIYLIDMDATNRDIDGGAHIVAGSMSTSTDGYVTGAKTKFDKTTWRATDWDWSSGITCGFKHGEIHVPFGRAHQFTAISMAGLIIHEATHKYLNTDDEAYANETSYPALSLAECLNNADSYAWAAVSLYCKEVKARTPALAQIDDRQCTKT